MTIDSLSRSARALLALGAVVLTAQSPTPVTTPWCTAIPLGHGCRPLAVTAPRAHLRLALAATEAQRERGLMDVPAVPAGEGMLFAFSDGDQQREFWMKNTITPLDMIWVRGNGVVASIAANVPATTPGTTDEQVARRGGVGSYVIELGAGEAARTGLAPGVKLVIPALEAQ